jgi:MoaA/NifB/PqqE/SkfB family radical SAM enzyme
MEATPTGAVRPCCLALDDIPELTVADGLTTAYQSESMQQLRQQFLNAERPKTCQRCWSEEDAGRTSKRQWHLRKFAGQTAQVDWYNIRPNHLWFLDLKLGNICNLKCRICGTWSSSKWSQEEIDYQTIDNPKTTRAYMQLRAGEWPRKTNTFWADLETLLPSIKYFEFTGGEPFLIKEHFELLQRAVDLGYASNISIHYNTNGTTWDDNFVNIWRYFKNVEIAFSIDNIDKRFEVERSGAKWNEVCANIAQARSLRDTSRNITLQVCITVNIQNVYYLEDLLQWVDTQGFNMVYVNMLHDPLYMNIAQMTLAAKQLVIDKLRAGIFHPRYHSDIDSIIRFIENGSSSNGQDFCDFMKRTDANRKENFVNSHKEIAEVMGYGS